MKVIFNKTEYPVTNVEEYVTETTDHKFEHYLAVNLADTNSDIMELNRLVNSGDTMTVVDAANQPRTYFYSICTNLARRYEPDGNNLRATLRLKNPA